MRRHDRRMFVSLCGLLVLTFIFTGCEPLRKKFTRKKKENKKQEFIPVLDPIDYPKSRVSAIEKYSYHYSLWQVWSKDFTQLLSQSGMDKRKNYLLSQIIQQLTEMERWVPREYTETLNEAILSYGWLQKEMEKPEAMRNRNIMETRLRRAESFIRNELKPEAVFVQE